MTTSRRLLLEFQPEHNAFSKGKELCDGLSVVLQIADTLWVANDETISLERLTLAPGSDDEECARAGGHKQFPLNDYLRLPVPPTGDPADLQEVDIEGLAHEDGYLWLVGSHSLKRKKPVLKDGAAKAQRQLSRVVAETNRYLLARIPVAGADGEVALKKEFMAGETKRTAAQLRARGKTNDLMDALKGDEHLAPFLAIPGKDNGFDIEGLAVSGKRVFVGLRGPVLRGWAVILELELKEDKLDPSILKLKRIGPGGRRYRKHFLDLGGLGIRDLCVQDRDLLILAGPSMDLDGPVTVFRWVDGTRPGDECMLCGVEGSGNDEGKGDGAVAGVLKRVVDVPYGQGVDHAEGICLYVDKDGPPALLVVYDAACASRQLENSVLAADVFPLPPG